MKTRLFKLIAAMALLFTAIPMHSQNYLKIWFKDGHTERHFMHLVQNISTTKYDLEGNLHSDYQMQQIVMPDTTYSYYIADIDSMSFRKVDEEKLKTLVDTTMYSIESLFKECLTIEDLASHIEYIKNMEGVEDAFREGNDLVVQIRDWRTVFYSYPFIPDVSPNYLSEIKKSFEKKVKSKLPIKKDGTKMKVVIAFQMIGDNRLANDYKLLQILLSHFNELGFETHFIPNEDGEIIDTDFFENRIFDYDIIFLVTHGGYNRKDKKHYFFTSIKGDPIIPSFWELIHQEYNHKWDIDYTSVSSCKTGEGYDDFGYFKIVSEDLIKKGKNFTGPGPHIVFNTACKSLYGDDELTRAYDGETFKGSDAVAKIFFDKGADIYIGETDDQCHAMAAGDAFFSKMMVGASEESAFSNLKSEYKVEYDKDNSVLIDLINPNSEYNNLQSLFFAEVHTKEKMEQEFNSEYINKGFIELEGGVIPLKEIGVSCGFKWTDDKNSENLTNWDNILISNNAQFSGIENGEVVFSAILDSDVLFNYKPGQTIYYRAFTYDGLHYNYGEIWYFKVPDFPNLSLESNTIELTSGDTKTIDITTGSRSYSIEKIEPTGVVTASISENHISIEALTAGTAIITVKDDKSGQEVKIEVTVWANLSIAIVGNIDLEVGASANVKIISGNNDYTLDSDKPEKVKLSLVGEFITVEALSDGTATITVTDNKTGQTASFTVTVTDPTPIHIPAEPINLGLPSGTLWASYNVGATKPEEYGNYYSWGETEVRDKYYFTTYSLCDGTVSSCHDIGEDISGTQYDVAHVKWGGEWLMPTKDDFQELVYNCEYKETTLNGVKGFQFTGPNGKFIFLPYTGYCWNTENNKVGSEGSYWSSTLTTSRNHAHEMSFSNGEMLWDCYINRFAGLTVRPVMHSTPTYDDLILSTYDPITMNVNDSITFTINSGSGSYAVESSNESVATVRLRDNYVDIFGEAAGTATITVSDAKNGQKRTIEVTITDNIPSPGTSAMAIDLGLPSGTKWADRNVGASSPEDYGGYYAWGETEEKSEFSRETYPYCNLTNRRWQWVDIGPDIAGTDYDTATANWGIPWRMPTQVQIDELLNYCSVEATIQNGVKGILFTGPNGSTIFLPDAGYKLDENLTGNRMESGIWSSTISGRDKQFATFLGFESSRYYDFRSIGRSVRPIQ